MTLEEAMALKNGDKVIIHAVLIGVPDGRYLQKLWVEVGGENKACFFVEVKDVSVPAPAPKYDPCRKFKRGDIVRLKEWNGRRPEMYSATNSWIEHPPKCKNGNLEVMEDEKDSMVKVCIIGAASAQAAAAPCYLELVSPVEELEPYSIDPETTTDILKAGEWYAYMGNADEAERLCQWLNKKHRKELQA